MYCSRLYLTCAIAMVASVWASNAVADVSFGQGYSCSGSTILNAKGKPQKFSKFKTKANEKIDGLKSALATAKKRKQASKVSLLTNNLNTQKALLQNARSCSKGTLVESPTPIGTGDSDGRPDRERPRPGDKQRPR